ncbi:MAG: type II toxin-antitoxin system RelE/ParE family toxin [Deltaproteobacteria bacterium]|nr:type II toxin-antitoxin system RelE/ParE family toxin [Deltaproteobacteria bacterium]
MLPFRLHREAAAELDDVAAAYAREDPELADRWLTAFEMTLDTVRLFPAVGPFLRVAVRPLPRRIVVDEFPFSIIYQSQRGRIDVLAVAHHRRHPLYWASRRMT